MLACLNALQAEERSQPPNLPAIKARIAELVRVLTDFRRLRDPFRNRGEYTECLAQDFADYYGYNRELVDLFMALFSPAEALQWFEANEQPRPVVIRVNTLKTRYASHTDASLCHHLTLLDVRAALLPEARRTDGPSCTFPLRTTERGMLY